MPLSHQGAEKPKHPFQLAFPTTNVNYRPLFALSQANEPKSIARGFWRFIHPSSATIKQLLYHTLGFVGKVSTVCFIELN